MKYRAFLAVCLMVCYLPTTLALQPVIPGAKVQVGFSPSGQALRTVQDAIASAKSEILLAAYSFTSKPVAVALIAAHKRGVSVRVVADHKANSNNYTVVRLLANNEIAVKLNDRYAIMHNKFLVIDKRSVQTGSFNYTSSADKRNAENVLWLVNVPAIAADYRLEFERLWSESVWFSNAHKIH